MTARVRLLGRYDCTLCEELHAELLRDPTLSAAGVEWVDLDDVPELREAYLFVIPVVLVDAVEAWRGPLTETTLEALHAAIAAAG